MTRLIITTICCQICYAHTPYSDEIIVTVQNPVHFIPQNDRIIEWFLFKIKLQKYFYVFYTTANNLCFWRNWLLNSRQSRGFSKQCRFLVFVLAMILAARGHRASTWSRCDDASHPTSIAVPNITEDMNWSFAQVPLSSTNETRPQSFPNAPSAAIAFSSSSTIVPFMVHGHTKRLYSQMRNVCSPRPRYFIYASPSIVFDWQDDYVVVK